MPRYSTAVTMKTIRYRFSCDTLFMLENFRNLSFAFSYNQEETLT